MQEEILDSGLIPVKEPPQFTVEHLKRLGILELILLVTLVLDYHSMPSLEEE